MEEAITLSSENNNNNNNNTIWYELRCVLWFGDSFPFSYLFTVWFVSDQVHLSVAPLPHNSNEQVTVHDPLPEMLSVSHSECLSPSTGVRVKWARYPQCIDGDLSVWNLFRVTEVAGNSELGFGVTRQHTPR